MVFCDITEYRGDNFHSSFRDQPGLFFEITSYINENAEQGYYFESEVYNNLLDFTINAELDIPDNIEAIWMNIWVYDFDLGRRESDLIDINGEYSDYQFGLSLTIQSQTFPITAATERTME